MWMFVAAALLSLGLVMLIAGIRGRRYDDHQICRRCGYDLDGLHAPSVCTECGSELGSKRSIRRGNRRSRPACVVTGTLSLLAAAGMAGVAWWAWSSGTTWRMYAPVGLLAWEVKKGGIDARHASIVEVHRRILAKRVEPEASLPFIARILTDQMDDSLQWNTSWGDLVEAAQQWGVLDDGMWQRYLLQAVQLEVRPRSTVLAGEYVPFEVHLVYRAGSSNAIWGQVRVTRASLSSGYDRWSDGAFNEGEEGLSDPRQWSLKVARVSAIELDRGTIQPPLATVADVGSTTLHVECQVISCYDRSGDEAPVMHTRHVSAKARVSVVAENAPPVQFVVTDVPQILERIEVPSSVTAVHLRDRSTRLSVAIRYLDVPIACAFDVILLLEDREWELGSLAIHPWTRGTINIQRTVQDLPRGRKARILLVPSARVARCTSDMWEVNGHSIEIDTFVWHLN